MDFFNIQESIQYKNPKNNSFFFKKTNFNFHKQLTNLNKLNLPYCILKVIIIDSYNNDAITYAYVIPFLFYSLFFSLTLFLQSALKIKIYLYNDDTITYA